MFLVLGHLQLDGVCARVVVTAWQIGVDMKWGRGDGGAPSLTHELVVRFVIWKLIPCVPILVVSPYPPLCSTPSKRSCELG